MSLARRVAATMHSSKKDVVVIMHLVLYRTTKCPQLHVYSSLPTARKSRKTNKTEISSFETPLPLLNLDQPLVSTLAFPFVTGTLSPSAFSSSTSFASFDVRQGPRCFLGCTSSVPLLETRSPFGPSFMSASLSGISLR